jgi:hypothetical protein
MLQRKGAQLVRYNLWEGAPCRAKLKL